MASELIERAFMECGLSEVAPSQVVIPREVLKKIISKVGIKETLNWINKGDLR